MIILYIILLSLNPNPHFFICSEPCRSINFSRQSPYSSTYVQLTTFSLHRIHTAVSIAFSKPRFLYLFLVLAGSTFSPFHSPIQRPTLVPISSQRWIQGCTAHILYISHHIFQIPHSDQTNLKLSLQPFQICLWHNAGGKSHFFRFLHPLLCLTDSPHFTGQAHLTEDQVSGSTVLFL